MGNDNSHNKEEPQKESRKTNTPPPPEDVPEEFHPSLEAIPVLYPQWDPNRYQEAQEVGQEQEEESFPSLFSEKLSVSATNPRSGDVTLQHSVWEEGQLLPALPQTDLYIEGLEYKESGRSSQPGTISNLTSEEGSEDEEYSAAEDIGLIGILREWGQQVSPEKVSKDGNTLPEMPKADLAIKESGFMQEQTLLGKQDPDPCISSTSNFKSDDAKMQEDFSLGSPSVLPLTSTPQLIPASMELFLRNAPLSQPVGMLQEPNTCKQTKEDNMDSNTDQGEQKGSWNSRTLTTDGVNNQTWGQSHLILSSTTDGSSDNDKDKLPIPHSLIKESSLQSGESPANLVGSELNTFCDNLITSSLNQPSLLEVTQPESLQGQMGETKSYQSFPANLPDRVEVENEEWHDATGHVKETTVAESMQPKSANHETSEEHGLQKTSTVDDGNVSSKDRKNRKVKTKRLKNKTKKDISANQVSPTSMPISLTPGIENALFTPIYMTEGLKEEINQATQEKTEVLVHTALDSAHVTASSDPKQLVNQTETVKDFPSQSSVNNLLLEDVSSFCLNTAELYLAAPSPDIKEDFVKDITISCKDQALSSPSIGEYGQTPTSQSEPTSQQNAKFSPLGPTRNESTAVKLSMDMGKVTTREKSNTECGVNDKVRSEEVSADAYQKKVLKTDTENSNLSISASPYNTEHSPATQVLLDTISETFSKEVINLLPPQEPCHENEYLLCLTEEISPAEKSETFSVQTQMKTSQTQSGNDICLNVSHQRQSPDISAKLQSSILSDVENLNHRPDCTLGESSKVQLEQNVSVVTPVEFKIVDTSLNLESRSTKEKEVPMIALSQQEIASSEGTPYPYNALYPGKALEEKVQEEPLASTSESLEYTSDSPFKSDETDKSISTTFKVSATMDAIDALRLLEDNILQCSQQGKELFPDEKESLRSFTFSSDKDNNANEEILTTQIQPEESPDAGTQLHILNDKSTQLQTAGDSFSSMEIPNDCSTEEPNSEIDVGNKENVKIDTSQDLHDTEEAFNLQSSLVQNLQPKHSQISTLSSPDNNLLPEHKVLGIPIEPCDNKEDGSPSLVICPEAEAKVCSDSTVKAEQSDITKSNTDKGLSTETPENTNKNQILSTDIKPITDTPEKSSYLTNCNTETSEPFTDNRNYPEEAEDADPVIAFSFALVEESQPTEQSDLPRIIVKDKDSKSYLLPEDESTVKSQSLSEEAIEKYSENDGKESKQEIKSCPSVTDDQKVILHDIQTDGCGVSITEKDQSERDVPVALDVKHMEYTNAHSASTEKSEETFNILHHNTHKEVHPQEKHPEMAFQRILNLSPVGEVMTHTSQEHTSDAAKATEGTEIVTEQNVTHIINTESTFMAKVGCLKNSESALEQHAPYKGETEFPSPVPFKDTMEFPSAAPSKGETEFPSTAPSEDKTEFPSTAPSKDETEFPSTAPSEDKTEFTSTAPHKDETEFPSTAPSEDKPEFTSTAPSKDETEFPSTSPSKDKTEFPSTAPSKDETEFPSTAPSKDETEFPSTAPSKDETEFPSTAPSKDETEFPSTAPSKDETEFPSTAPSKDESEFPSTAPSEDKNEFPSTAPHKDETEFPSTAPSKDETELPSTTPHKDETEFPSTAPSKDETEFPFTAPSKDETEFPSTAVSEDKTEFPSTAHSKDETEFPSTRPSQISSAMTNTNSLPVKPCEETGAPNIISSGAFDGHRMTFESLQPLPKENKENSEDTTMTPQMINNELASDHLKPVPEKKENKLSDAISQKPDSSVPEMTEALVSDQQIVKETDILSDMSGFTVKETAILSDEPHWPSEQANNVSPAISPPSDELATLVQSASSEKTTTAKDKVLLELFSKICGPCPEEKVILQKMELPEQKELSVDQEKAPLAQAGVDHTEEKKHFLTTSPTGIDLPVFDLGSSSVAHEKLPPSPNEPGPPSPVVRSPTFPPSDSYSFTQKLRSVLHSDRPVTKKTVKVTPPEPMVLPPSPSMPTGRTSNERSSDSEEAFETPESTTPVKSVPPVPIPVLPEVLDQQPKQREEEETPYLPPKPQEPDLAPNLESTEATDVTNPEDFTDSPFRQPSRSFSVVFDEDKPIASSGAYNLDLAAVEFTENDSTSSEAPSKTRRKSTDSVPLSRNTLSRSLSLQAADFQLEDLPTNQGGSDSACSTLRRTKKAQPASLKKKTAGSKKQAEAVNTDDSKDVSQALPGESQEVEVDRNLLGELAPSPPPSETNDDLPVVQKEGNLPPLADLSQIESQLSGVTSSPPVEIYGTQATGRLSPPIPTHQKLEVAPSGPEIPENPAVVGQSVRLEFDYSEEGREGQPPSRKGKKPAGKMPLRKPKPKKAVEKPDAPPGAPSPVPNDPDDIPIGKGSYTYNLDQWDDPNFNPFSSSGKMQDSPSSTEQPQPEPTKPIVKRSESPAKTPASFEISAEPNGESNKPAKKKKTPLKTDTFRVKKSPKRSPVTENGSEELSILCKSDTPPVIASEEHATDEEKLASSVSSQKWACMAVDLEQDKQDYPQPSDLTSFVKENQFHNSSDDIDYGSSFSIEYMEKTGKCSPIRDMPQTQSMYLMFEAPQDSQGKASVKFSDTCSPGTDCNFDELDSNLCSGQLPRSRSPPIMQDNARQPMDRLRQREEEPEVLGSGKMELGSPEDDYVASEALLSRISHHPALCDQLSYLEPDLAEKNPQAFAQKLQPEALESAEIGLSHKSLYTRSLAMETAGGGLLHAYKQPEIEAALQLAREEIAAKEQETMEWKKKYEESRCEVVEMRKIVAEYEQTIAQMIEDEQREKSVSNHTVQQLIIEKEQALADLNSVEKSLADLFRRYEKMKDVLEGFRKNEEVLKKCAQEYLARVKKEEQRYHALKIHAEEKLDRANSEIAQVRSKSQQEQAAYQASLRKEQLRVDALERTLEQKNKEIEELTKICDELIAKMGKS
ncbi:transforming acidic coiled-coil-containing protein 2 isoform X2 [Dendropsophus ebraccatus]|uniref:transforming acidic coiled-coil-containing protein 2 isoform X2 n=1 Tax=Dendropsophus ebraccatus TaxID=150705 RepID=UPI003831FA67